MKKLIILFLSLFVLSAVFLSACDKNGDEVNKILENEDHMIEYDLIDVFVLPVSVDFYEFLIIAYTHLTTGNFSEAIEYFNKAKILNESPSVFLETGLGKAYFYNNNFEEAQKLFDSAFKLAPDRNDILLYLGESQLLSGNFEQSTKNFQKLLQIYPDDVSIFVKLEQSLRGGKYFDDLLTLYEEGFESINDDKDNQIVFFAGKLLETAVLMNDDELVVSFLGRFKDEEFGDAMQYGYTAYKLLIINGDAATKDFLFDPENIEILNSWNGSIYFGGLGNRGEPEGIGFTMENSKVHFGEFKGSHKNGFGIRYNGDIDERNIGRDVTVRKRGIFIEGNWINGIPVGDVLNITKWINYSNGKYENSGTTTIAAFYIDGMAQGEIWTETQYNYNSSSEYTKHMVKDGLPILFEANVNGRVRMVYKAGGSSKDSFSWSSDDQCNCTFIFS